MTYPHRIRIAFLSLLIAGLGCAGAPDSPAPAAPVADDGLSLVSGWLTGSFSSRAQSLEDPDFFDIRIHAVRIWQDREDGHWIYLEQAAAENLERPYRQRVYHVTRLAEDLFESRVYALEDADRFIGAWGAVAPLSEVTPEQLVPRPGCSVLLRRVDEHRFAGGTLGRLCESSLRGATCATSEVTVTAARLSSWDRGFDDEHHQVWGAEKGPYRFDRE